MTQQGFEEYVYAAFVQKSGAACSYIMAVKIVDEMFTYQDVFHLHGRSVTTINDPHLLERIVMYVREHQTLFKNGQPSLFSNINPRQHSYAKNSFCLAAIKQVQKYCAYEAQVDQDTQAIIGQNQDGRSISAKLIDYFKIDRRGSDVERTTRTRLGQSYFRKMVLANYGEKCCITGLNVPNLLRASHIIAWVDDEANRMNPENGLCLSATYDAAFDKHLISFDEDYRMIVSREIKDYYTNDTTKEYFDKYEGKSLVLPELYLPSQELLEKHREMLVG